MRIQLHSPAFGDKENMESAVIECDDSLNSLLQDFKSLIRNVYKKKDGEQ